MTAPDHRAAAAWIAANATALRVAAADIEAVAVDAITAQEDSL